MPRRLRILGSVFCALGVLSIVSMFVDALRGQGLSIAISIFLLPVGVGLLRAKPSSRRWATFWAGLVLLIAIVTMGFMLTVGVGKARVFGHILSGVAAGAYAWAVTIGIAGLSALAIWVLYTPPVSLAFRSSEDLDSPDAPSGQPV